MAERRDRPKHGPLHWLGCLLQVPLGCLAFLLGGTIVLVAFLPFAVGGVVSRWGAEQFALRHAGSLEIADAWLGSLYGKQTVSGIVLRDSQGVDVLRGSLEAPSFGTLLFGSGSSWGPVRLHLERLDLRRVGGRLRLLDALADDGGQASAGSGEQRKVRIDPHGAEIDKRILVELHIDRLLASDGEGRPIDLRDAQARASIRIEPDASDSSRGVVRIEGAGRTRLGLDGESSLGLAWKLDVGEESVVWHLSLDADRIEGRLLSALLPDLSAGPGFEDEAFDALHLNLGRSEPGETVEVDLRARVQGAALELRGQLHPRTKRLEAGANGSLELSVPSGTPTATRLLTALLPFVASAPGVPGEGSESVHLTLSKFELDLAGPRLLVRAEGRLDTGLAPLEVAPALRRALHLRDRTRLLGPCRFRVGSNGLSYNELRYDAEGGAVEVSGSCSFANAPVGLSVRLPRGGLFEVIAGPNGPRLTPSR